MEESMNFTTKMRSEQKECAATPADTTVCDCGHWRHEYQKVAKKHNYQLTWLLANLFAPAARKYWTR